MRKKIASFFNKNDWKIQELSSKKEGYPHFFCGHPSGMDVKPLLRIFSLIFHADVYLKQAVKRYAVFINIAVIVFVRNTAIQFLSGTLNTHNQFLLGNFHVCFSPSSCQMVQGAS